MNIEFIRGGNAMNTRNRFVTWILTLALLFAAPVAQAVDPLTFARVARIVRIPTLTEVLVEMGLLTATMALWIQANIVIISNPFPYDPWTLSLLVGGTVVTICAVLYAIRSISVHDVWRGCYRLLESGKITPTQFKEVSEVLGLR